MSDELSRISDLESKLNTLIQYHEYITRHIEEQLDCLTPVGSIVPYTGYAREPAGYLECDGRALAKAEFQRLYGVVSLRFTPESEYGLDHFRIPDLRLRTLVGQTNEAIPNLGDRLTIGKTIGQMEMALKEAHVPPHTHEGKAFFLYYKDDSAREPGPSETFAPQLRLNLVRGDACTNYACSAVTTENNITPVPFSIVQPSMGVRFLIRAKSYLEVSS